MRLHFPSTPIGQRTVKTKKRWEATRLRGVWRLVATGMLYARFRIGKKQVWRSLNTTALDVAESKAPLLKAALKSADVVDRITLGQCADIYWKRLVSLKMADAALEFRKTTLEVLRRSWVGFNAKRADSVTVWDCNRWADELRSQYGPRRFNGMLEALRGVLDIAVESGALAKDILMPKGGITRNPARLVRRAKNVVKVRPVPDRELFAKILKDIATYPRGAKAVLGIQAVAYTGLRPPSEPRRVLPEDVDLKRGTLLIRGSKNTPDQLVPLTPAAVKLFTRNWDTIFEALKNNPRTAIRAACRRLKIPRLRWYDFRHLFGTRLLQNNVDIRTAADLMRHKDKGATLLKVYAQIHSAHTAAAVKRVRF